ncbi:MAG: serine/threonine-protein kinase [Planctomycetota bacterium]
MPMPFSKLGKYKIISLIGGGGMGEIFLAKQEEIDRKVVVKVLPQSFSNNESMVARFRQEVHVLGQLSHPNICSIIDVGEQDGTYYYVMEYLAGRDLGWVIEMQRITPERAADIVRQAAEALHFVHKQGIIHRDIKPQNIILTRTGQVRQAKKREYRSSMGRILDRLWGGRDKNESAGYPAPDGKAAGASETLIAPIPKHMPTGPEFASKEQTRPAEEREETPSPEFYDHAYIIDFGLARESGAQALTMTGDLIGTPAYMAPEQAAGAKEKFGPGIDIYSLGVILYEMLTLQKPFNADSPAAMIAKVIKDEPIRPFLLKRDIPKDLETIILKCMEKEPRRRYSSAQALAEDIHRWQEGEPIWARPIGLAERAYRWFRRHPAAAIATGFIMVFAAVILIISLLVAGGWKTVYKADFTAGEGRNDWTGFEGNFGWHDGALCIGRGEQWSAALSRQAYFGNIRLEYIAQIMPDSLAINDLSCFIDGSEKSSFYTSGYYFGVGGNNNTRSHMLRKGENVVAANLDFRLERERLYKIVAEKIGPEMSVTVNGRKLYEYRDFFPLLEVEGRVGLYSSTHAHIKKITIYHLKAPAFPDEMTDADGRYNAKEYLAAAYLYEGITKKTDKQEVRELAGFKQAVSLWQHSVACGQTGDKHRAQAKQILEGLADSARSPRLRIEAQAALAVILIENGEIEQGATVLARNLESVATASERFIILNVLDQKANEFYRKGNWSEYERLVATFTGHIPLETLVLVGGDNFRSVAIHWAAILVSRRQWREAAEFLKSCYDKIDNSASGQMLFTGVQLLCLNKDFDKALHWLKEERENIRRVRKLHRPDCQIPIEEDPYWAVLYQLCLNAEIDVCCKAGRFEEAERAIEEEQQIIAGHEKIGITGKYQPWVEIVARGQVAIFSQNREAMKRVARIAEQFMQNNPYQEEFVIVASMYQNLLCCLGEYEKAIALLEGTDKDKRQAGWNENFARSRMASLDTFVPAYMAARTPAEVLNYVSELLKISPNSLVLNYYAASGGITAERHEEQSAHYYSGSAARLEMLRGNPWDLRLQLAVGYELHGEKEKARGEYRRALEMMPWKTAKWYFCTEALKRLKEQ